MLKNILEAINIVRKGNGTSNSKEFKRMKYVGKNDYGFRITFYNTKDHNFAEKVKERTDLDWKTAEKKISKGIDLMLYKYNKGKFKGRTDVALTFTESKFKVIYRIVPDIKLLTAITILSIDMKTKKAIPWNIKESLEGLNIDFENIEEFEIKE